MEKNVQNKKKSNSELIPFNISILPKLQYVKIIFIGTNKELYEMRTEVNTINLDTIQLTLNSKDNINITCPTGVALKFITVDAIYYAKAILKDLKKLSDKYIFILDAPQKTIRQQNRKFYRINIDCHCVLLINNKKSNNQTYIGQTVNISKGGVLIYNIEPISDDTSATLPLSKDETCYIVLFLEQKLRVKVHAKFIRSEYVDGVYRYAFEFIKIPQRYVATFDRYITNEELKMLKVIKGM